MWPGSIRCCSSRAGWPSTSWPTYRRLAQHLELDRPALSFEPPGVAPGTVPRPSVPAAARWYWSRIQERFPDGPLRLVGHSLGAIMALEVARLARAAGRPIGALDLLDPRLPARSPTFGSRLRIEVSAARRRGRAELARAGLLGGPGGGLSPRAAAARMDQDLVVAASQARARYRPRTYDGPVTVLVARGTDEQPAEPGGGDMLVTRWSPLLPHARFIDVPGMHVGPDGMLAEPHIAATADAIRPSLT